MTDAASDSDPAMRSYTTLAVWGFTLTAMVAAIVGLIANGIGDDPPSFDRAVFLAIRSADDITSPLGPDWLGGVMRDVTALGSASVVIAISVIAIGFGAGARWGWTTATVAAAALGGLALGEGVKLIFNRARPDLVPHAVDTFTHSFPSGHATASAAAYLTLAVLVADRYRERRFARGWIVAVGILITVLVGFSRLYLGVHWPTDVLAGWALGGFWALSCIYLERHLIRRSRP